MIERFGLQCSQDARLCLVVVVPTVSCACVHLHSCKLKAMFSVSPEAYENDCQGA
jgi:hypothetical protein